MLKNRILSSVGGEEKLYSNDVFTSYVRTGTGADAVINTGIDMTKGYMLWSKSRSASTDHAVYDSARGVTLDLVTNSTAAQTTQSTGLKAVSSTGHTVGSLAKMNTSGATYVDWVWKKAPKFFDVVTWTGDGVGGRRVSHSLGVAPGMWVVKQLNTTRDWLVKHRSIASGDYLGLNLTQASATSSVLNGGADATSFDVNACNGAGDTYVAYLFAHDPSADGIIQCGSFTTDASGNATVNLGWEPQYVMTKRTDAVQEWRINDSVRGAATIGGQVATLYPNLSNSEISNTEGSHPSATGFVSTGLAISGTFIYLAIRRPNKPPTTGTEVYNAIARTGTGAAATVTAGYPVDLVITKKRSSTTLTGARFTDRLRGKTNWLDSTATTAETTTADTVTGLDSMTGVVLGADATTSAFNTNTHTYVNHFFKRSPGFMDVVCYTGTGVARTVPHSLGVAPELMILKKRNSSGGWPVYHSSTGITGSHVLYLNLTNGTGTGSTYWTAQPQMGVFTVGSDTDVNASATSYVAYLFASLPGISKVGSYTGNGTTQTINCGFTTGARFILIKRTDSTGNWIIADSTRGILSSADPALYLNSTAAEVTGVDWVDPNIVGFDIIQEGTMNANVNGASYIFMAIA